MPEMKVKAKVIKLTRANTAAVIGLVKDSENDLLTVGKAANMCVEKGVAAVRKRFVKASEK